MHAPMNNGSTDDDDSNIPLGGSSAARVPTKYTLHGVAFFGRGKRESARKNFPTNADELRGNSR